MVEKQEVLSYLREIAESLALRMEIHVFDSGAMMVDIWAGECFLVIQVFEGWVGLSNGAEPDFSTVPDHKFDSFMAFRLTFERELELGLR